MKHSIISSIFILSVFIGCSACSKNDNAVPNNTDTTSIPNNTDTTSNRLRITIGSNTFNATLLSNPTVTEFKRRLPMTVTMSELNGNEKLYNFSTSLPTNAANPGNITTGDLMLYGSNVLVLFYQSFSTSYSYTRLGRIDNASGLAAALGTGSVTVSYALQ
jgi:hypothetical protein